MLYAKEHSAQPDMPHPHLSSLQVLTRAQRTRLHFCPKHLILFHLGLYKFEFEFGLYKERFSYIKPVEVSVTFNKNKQETTNLKSRLKT